MNNFNLYLATKEYTDAVDNFDKVGNPDRVCSGECSMKELEAAGARLTAARDRLHDLISAESA